MQNLCIEALCMSGARVNSVRLESTDDFCVRTPVEKYGTDISVL